MALPADSPITANGSTTWTAPAAGTYQLAVGNVASDDFDSANVTVKLGASHTLTGFDAITAGHVANVTLARGDVLTVATAGGAETTQSITVTIKPVPA